MDVALPMQELESFQRLVSHHEKGFDFEDPSTFFQQVIQVVREQIEETVVEFLLLASSVAEG